MRLQATNVVNVLINSTAGDTISTATDTNWTLATQLLQATLPSLKPTDLRAVRVPCARTLRWPLASTDAAYLDACDADGNAAPSAALEVPTAEGAGELGMSDSAQVTKEAVGGTGHGPEGSDTDVAYCNAPPSPPGPRSKGPSWGSALYKAAVTLTLRFVVRDLTPATLDGLSSNRDSSATVSNLLSRGVNRDNDTAPAYERNTNASSHGAQPWATHPAPSSPAPKPTRELGHVATDTCQVPGTGGIGGMGACAPPSDDLDATPVARGQVGQEGGLKGLLRALRETVGGLAGQQGVGGLGSRSRHRGVQEVARGVDMSGSQPCGVLQPQSLPIKSLNDTVDLRLPLGTCSAPLHTHTHTYTSVHPKILTDREDGCSMNTNILSWPHLLIRRSYLLFMSVCTFMSVCRVRGAPDA